MTNRAKLDLATGEVSAIDFTEEEQAARSASSLESLRTSILYAAQERLDGFARTRNYDGILSACSYAGSAVPKFAAEGAYCVALRDQTWATLYSMLADVEAGTRVTPTGFAEIEAELPTASAQWPA